MRLIQALDRKASDLAEVLLLNFSKIFLAPLKSYLPLQTNPEEAATTQHVRDLGKNMKTFSARKLLGFDQITTPEQFLNFLKFFPQDDDVDGEHIIAFAEEADPGKRTLH